MVASPPGLSFLGGDQPLDSAPGDAQDGVELLVNGSTVVALFQVQPGTSGDEDLFINVSNDGGASFAGDFALAGTPSTAAGDVDSPTGFLRPGGEITVVWDDDRAGADDVFLRRSTDGGATFGPELLLSTDGGNAPAVAGAGDVWAVVWEDLSAGDDGVGAALSTDGGASWLIADAGVDDTVGDSDSPRAAYAALYRNFLVSWPSEAGLGVANTQYAGGFRPQQFREQGLDPAGSNLSFQLDRFGSADAFAFVLGSLGNGPFPLADGRLLDLTGFGDPVFDLTFSGGFFLAPLSGGSGATGALPVAPLGGFAIQVAAVGLDVTASVASITDAFPVVLP